VEWSEKPFEASGVSSSKKSFLKNFLNFRPIFGSSSGSI
jgi:hypothetical protein